MATDKKTNLLTLEERAICERVGAMGEAPHSQRAQALLALDEGLSQTEAGERTGLTSGQVKYWLGKFQQQRAGIFPEELHAQPVPAQLRSGRTPEKEPKSEQAEETTDEAQPAKMDGKKIKKSKKIKDKKKKSKDVKDKSAKKKKSSKKKRAKKAKSKKKKGRKKEKSKKVKKDKG